MKVVAEAGKTAIKAADVVYDTFVGLVEGALEGALSTFAREASGLVLDDISKKPAGERRARDCSTGSREGRCDTRMAHSLPWYLHLASLAAIVAAANVVVYFRSQQARGVREKALPPVARIHAGHVRCQLFRESLPQPSPAAGG